MDLRLERDLLQMLDELLSGDESYSAFIGFQEGFTDTYFRRIREVTADLDEQLDPEMSLSEQAATPIGQEILRLEEELLPAGRHAAFSRIAEWASYVLPECPDKAGRYYGYMSVGDFFERVRGERELYRTSFGA